jgi:hypothetical protein
MNIDERLEALTMNLELLAHDVQQNTQHIRALAQILETSLDAIKRLEAVASSHERRITNLEQ